MTESSIHAPPGARLLFASRHAHSASLSSSGHRRQPSDDFISRLSPLTALDTLRAPTGPLKDCMDAATAAERSFAVRSALASRNICEWLDELRAWPWSAQDGAGFLPPAGAAGATTYIGCLPEPDVARYETRLDQIQAELDRLEIEEIKKHVLHNYIMPLSRPGTPASPTLERHFGLASLASYTKMDDMTAVITAIVVQALPELSKLIQLMSTWGVRLTVLRRIPSWLDAVADAESAVQTGWATIRPEPKSQDEKSAAGTATRAPALTTHDFDVMRLVLEKEISKAARVLDFMLDTLEGRDDVLPDAWLDRMETVERDFSEWIAACEGKIRDAELAALKESAQGDSEESGNAQAGAASGLVISIEHVSDADRLIPSLEVDDVSDGSSTIAVTEESEPTLKGSDNGDGAMPDSELDGDYFSLDPPSDQGSDKSTPAQTTSKSAHPKSSTSTQARQRDPSMTPELLPADSSRRSPHTPPREIRSVSLPLSDMPPVPEDPEDEDEDPLQTPLTSAYDTPCQELGSPIILSDPNGDDDHMRQQIAEILENLPAKIQLSSKPTFLSHLNPPDLQLPYTKPKATADKSARSRSTMSCRASTPAFMLAPVARPRQQRTNQDIKMYHLSRANGEAPIKLFIRCVGVSGERVMVRVGGGWADLGEYLKEYAIHHGRRSHRGSEQKLEVRDIPRSASSMSNRASTSPPTRPGPSPPSRPGSAADVSPIFVKKTRKASAGEDLLGPRLPRTPIAYAPPRTSEPSSVGSASGSTTGRSRSSSRLSWTEEESSLGMAGPRGSRKEIPVESLEWVESIKNKVRAASAGSEIPRSSPAAAAAEGGSGKFGELGRVGGTKRVFRKAS